MSGEERTQLGGKGGLPSRAVGADGQLVYGAVPHTQTHTRLDAHERDIDKSRATGVLCCASQAIRTQPHRGATQGMMRGSRYDEIILCLRCAAVTAISLLEEELCGHAASLPAWPSGSVGKLLPI